MPSAALTGWQQDRAHRLSKIDLHCREVDALVPPDLAFLDETLRGYVLHLSAHFQGFCRDLYSECAQLWIDSIPTSYRVSAQSQFSTGLLLDRGNPSYENLKRDFNRFGVRMDLQVLDALGPKSVTDLSHLNEWRNKASHQDTQPLRAGVPIHLTANLVATWRASCELLASLLDRTMYDGMSLILGNPPW